jgi:hypothetical protein
VRATLAAFELTATRHALDPGRPWETAVRDGLRLALRGRLALAAGAPGATGGGRWLDARLAALVL